MNLNSNDLFSYEYNQDLFLLRGSNTTKPQCFAASSSYILNLSLPLLDWLFRHSDVTIPGILNCPSMAHYIPLSGFRTGHPWRSLLAIPGTLTTATLTLAIPGTLILLAWPSLPSQLASRYPRPAISYGHSLALFNSLFV